jgi:hypothetical protein
VAQDDNAVAQMAGISPGIRPEEMHLTEEWYHGDITRVEAKNRIENTARTLAAEGKDPEGLFLVRDSSTFKGEFALTLHVAGDVRHMRLSTTPYDSMNASRKYYLHVSGVHASAHSRVQEHIKKDTVYELIAYHQRHPVTNMDCGDGGRSVCVRLNTTCLQPRTYENEVCVRRREQTQL